MDEGNFSDYRANKWLDQIGSLWIALHYADPSISGAYASEVFGGSYTRVKAEFSDADNRSIFNTSSIIFRGMPNVNITFIGGWDAHYNGNLELYIPLATPAIVQAGKTYTIDASMLAISLP
jgi:hypothetical protein